MKKVLILIVSMIFLSGCATLDGTFSSLRGGLTNLRKGLEEINFVLGVKFPEIPEIPEREEEITPVVEPLPAEILVDPTDSVSDTADINHDFDISNVTWLHTDVSSWPVTSTLNVRIQGIMIYLDYDKANVWPGVDYQGGLINANPWIFVEQGGKWYAATWEYFRPGQTAKPKNKVAGDHIKKDPLKDFVPVVGTKYYAMVSGLCRQTERNVQERTNIVPFIWQ